MYALTITRKGVKWYLYDLAGVKIFGHNYWRRRVWSKEPNPNYMFREMEAMVTFQRDYPALGECIIEWVNV